MDDEDLWAKLRDVKPPVIPEVNNDFVTVTMVFMPNELERVREAFNAADRLSSANEVWIARRAEYDRLLQGLMEVSRTHLLRNMSGALAILCSVFENHAEDMAEGFIDPDGTPIAENWIPISTVLGKNMPADAAAVVRYALSKIAKEVDPDMKPWQALELLAADSLGGM